MITSSFEAMARLFAAGLAELGDDQPRLNVSPTEPIPVVVSHDGDRTIVPMRWGLLPPFYRTANGGPLLINARAEGIATKPAYREAVQKRRCLVPADGFYEWQGPKDARVPWLIRPAAGGPMALAGLWQDWRSPEGWISTCAIVTCEPNATLAPIHDRMPVVIAPARLRPLARRGRSRRRTADAARPRRRARRVPGRPRHPRAPRPAQRPAAQPRPRPGP